MIDYEMYEDDEVLKPRHIAKKPKTKKADHKHEYQVEMRDAYFSTNYLLSVEICKVCGREGHSTIMRKVD